MKILCVAEKPSIAKAISEILSSGNGYQNRPGKDKYCRNFEFQYRMPPGRNFGARGVPGDWTDMVVTSVKGHLMGSDFPESFRKWTSCSPSALFSAPIETFVSKECRQVAQNLKEEVRRADLLMIWTDCDREGEHIGAEVVKVCREVNRHIPVKRAKFSAIIANQIHTAAQNPVELDWRAAEAVDSRIELDLRLGAAFTRLQCLALQQSAQLQSRVISYGPCQFPTLGFVVDRYILARDFNPEPFWYIAVTDKREEMEVDFRWSRNHLMDQQAVRVIFQRCQANPEATVSKVTSKVTRKFKPSPLTTVELQKSGGRLLRLTPKRVLEVAEKLYQRGILSYPRTETDQYDKDFDFHTLLDKQKSDGAWGTFAARLADRQGGAFERPVDGRKNDKAHPPIHPTRHAGDLVGEEKKVYEYVTRRFLASCSKHAVGKQTTVDLTIAKELFTASGVVVVERNYLEVYTYDKWGGPALPAYHEGERFVPAKMEMKEGETSRPKLLTEADLVSLMDRNGIGTDATIAEHIAKIIEREYVKLLKEGQTNYLIPSELGMGLVEGYNAIEFDGNKSLCKPLLRRETEERMTLICQGSKTREETVRQSLQEYRVVFDKTQQDMAKLIERVTANMRGEYAQGGSSNDNDGGGGGQDREAVVEASGSRVGPAATEVVVIDDDEDEDDNGDGPPTSNLRPRRASGTVTGRSRTATSSTSNAFSSFRPTTARTTPSGNNNGAGPSSSNVCFTCGERGHWSYDCPGSSRTGANQDSSDEQACFTCGKRGHWASACTEAQTGRASKRGRGSSSRGASASRGNGATTTRGRGRGRGRGRR